MPSKTGNNRRPVKIPKDSKEISESFMIRPQVSQFNLTIHNGQPIVAKLFKRVLSLTNLYEIVYPRAEQDKRDVVVEVT